MDEHRIQIPAIELPGRLHLPRIETQSSFLALLGPSGSGKSSLLQTLAGFTGTADYPHAVDWMPQDLGVWAGLSVRDHFASNAPSNPERVEYWLTHLDLASMDQQEISSCSVGEQARAALGRALCGSAGTLLLDEPLAHLAPGTRERYWDLILRDCRDRTRSLIYASHQPETVLRTGGDALWLQPNGQYGGCLPVEELYQRPPDAESMSLLGPGLWTGQDCVRPGGLSWTEDPNGTLVVATRHLGTWVEVELGDGTRLPMLPGTSPQPETRIQWERVHA